MQTTFPREESDEILDKYKKDRARAEPGLEFLFPVVYFSLVAIQPARVEVRLVHRQVDKPAHHHKGPRSPTTNFRKRFHLSGHGASRAAACAAPQVLRSYRTLGRTLLSESPPLTLNPHGATRYGTVRGSHVRYQLLRNVAPLSQQSPSLPAPLRFPQPDVP